MARAVVLFTGGKDSVYALHAAVKEGYDVRVLATVIPHYKYSMLYHQPRFEALLAQAQSTGIPLETIGLYEPQNEVGALRHLFKRTKGEYGVEAVVMGAVKSLFQLRAFREAAESLGLKVYAPIWGRDELDYMRGLLRGGVEFIIVSITSMGIPHSMLGKVFDETDLEKLSKLSEIYGFNLSFEGGEAETLVINAPLFKYRLVVHGRRVTLSEFEGYFDIEKVALVKKGTGQPVKPQ